MNKTFELTKEDLEKELDKLIKNGWLEESKKQDLINKLSGLKFTSPNKDNVFNALKLFKPEETQVLIIGQDPYPNIDRAHGLAFSFKNGDKAEDSIKNIFKAICKYQKKYKNYYDIKDDDIKYSTNLLGWAKSNKVLLLNTALTYEKTTLHEKTEIKTKKQKQEIKNAQNKLFTKHKNIWKPFFDEIIKNLLASNKNIVVFLWGEKAKKAYNNATKNLDTNNTKVFETSHPSPQGATRGFYTCAPRHFKQCDELLNNKIWLNLE